MQTTAEPRLESLELPPLTLDQRTALKDSIRAEGILSPIVQDQFGAVIDGYERLAIAGELGIRTYPCRTVHCTDERTRRHLRLQLNCNRRQFVMVQPELENRGVRVSD